MNGDLLFWALSVAALLAALVSAGTGDARRGGKALAVAGVAAAGLFALLGASASAVLLAAASGGGLLLLRRTAAGDGAIESAMVGADHAATDVAGAGAGEGAGAGAGGDVPAESAGQQPVSSSRLRLARRAVLVVAFFVIVARALLMARWPAAASADSSPALLVAVGLPHFLLASVVLLCVGLFGASTGRRLHALATGSATAMAAAALGLAAAGRFVGGAGEANVLAAIAVAAASLPLLLVQSLGSPWTAEPEGDGVADHAAAALALVLAGITLALLAGAW